MPAPTPIDVHRLLSGDTPHDPRADALALLRVVAARRPAASALLDVSGDADLLPVLGERFEHVEVVTPSSADGVAAHRALPDAAVHETEPARLRLGRRFDVVTALGAALTGLTLASFAATAERLAQHLLPGGLLLIEPFWLPDHATRRTTDTSVSRDDRGRTVSAVRRCAPRDGAQVVEWHALVADEDGVRHVSDVRTRYAFGALEYTTALAAAGCAGEVLPAGLPGRPLVVATRR